MSGRSHELLAADLGPLLPTFAVLPDPRSLGELDPAKRGWVQLIRDERRLNPVAPEAQYQEQFYIWVITPLLAQPDAENDLYDSLDLVRAAIESLSTSAIDHEKRMTHPDGKHAYRIAATFTTDKE